MYRFIDGNPNGFSLFFESVTFLFIPLEYPTERQAWMELEREEVGEAEDF